MLSLASKLFHHHRRLSLPLPSTVSKIPRGHLTQRCPLLTSHLHTPVLVHVRSSLHENWDGFVVLVHGRQAQGRLVLVVIAVGAAPCRVRKGTNSHKSLHSVAPPRPPSRKSLLEVNCLTQERGEAGSPGPALKTSRHTGDGLKFLSPAPPPPTQQEAPRGTTLLFQQTGSSHRVTDHGFCPLAWKLFGFLCTFLYFFFAIKISNR